MIAAWFSVAASRSQITFDSIPDYPDTKLEPAIRMLFVATVALIFALFLHLSLITIIIGKVDLASFMDTKGVALLVGFIAGITQKALSVQLMDRAKGAQPEHELGGSVANRRSIGQRRQHLGGAGEVVVVELRELDVDALQQPAALAGRHRYGASREQHGFRDVERGGDLLDGFERRRGLAALDLAHHGDRQPDRIGEVFLAQASRLAVMPHIGSEGLGQAHGTSLPRDPDSTQRTIITHLQRMYNHILFFR